MKKTIERIAHNITPSLHVSVEDTPDRTAVILHMLRELHKPTDYWMQELLRRLASYGWEYELVDAESTAYRVRPLQLAGPHMTIEKDITLVNTETGVPTAWSAVRVTDSEVHFGARLTFDRRTGEPVGESVTYMRIHPKHLTK